MNPNLKYYLAVNKVNGIGPTKIKHAIDLFGDVRSFWHAKRNDLFQVDGFTEKIINSFERTRNELDIDKEVEGILNSPYKVITIEDDNYPSNLKNIYDPPTVLYVDGELLPSDKKAIAIVGTRKPTHYGIETAKRFAKELSNYGFTIISGLAMGIDSEAHKGALENNKRTISVYGCGIDYVHPSFNQKLAKRISVSGANISEFPMGQMPDKWTFPQRNRIISGLSLGVIVIEGLIDSGALITAKQALEQGREVFAVPGNVKSELSKGPHSLIKDGAKLIESVEDVLDELNIYVDKKAVVEQKNYDDLSIDEKRLISNLSYEPIIIENIISGSNMQASDVLRLLSMLEMRNYIKQLPGKNYILV